MRSLIRTAALVATAMLIPLGLAPTGQAAPPEDLKIVVFDGYSYQYTKTCPNESPYTECGTYATTMYVQIQVQNDRWPGWEPMTADYMVEDITAVNGVDYRVAASGTVSFPSNSRQVSLPVRIVDTGGPDKTFRVRLTGSSVPADISTAGIGTIFSGGVIPRDCDFSRTGPGNVSLTCGSRPSGQEWHLSASCFVGDWPNTTSGNRVTGNGTSRVVCSQGIARPGRFIIDG